MKVFKEEGKKVILRLENRLNKLKVYFKNSRLLTFAMFFTILWLLLELVARIYDFYRIIPWIDIPSHILAGIALAAFLTWFIYQSNIKRKNLLVILWVIAVSTVFEIGEILEEKIFPNQPLHLQDIFFWDGFWDIIMAIIGGLIFLALFKYRLRKMLKVA